MKPLSALLLVPLAAALPVLISGCESERDATTRDTDRPATVSDPDRDRRAHPATTPGEGGREVHAVAEIRPTSGNEVRGTLHLSSGNGTVKIAGTISGLEPGAHGMHVHEFGDCSAPDASSAGEHFNPHDDPHGSPRDLENAHHVGDLGNIIANDRGEAEVDLEDNEMQLSGPESVIGKAMVVHADQDDFESQPSGNSGARVGCGEIVETTAQ